MRLAIMQPYLFPYIGYFQLIGAVDRFVIYDDVAFIKQGWINRNRILLNHSAHMFTVQLSDASSFKLINETHIHEKNYTHWKSKFIKTLESAYKHAPHFEEVCELIAVVLDSESHSISKLAANSLFAVSNFLQLKTEFVWSSLTCNNSHLHSEARVLDICTANRASEYLNSEGGMQLYSKAEFLKQGIQLKFLKPGSIAYPQFEKQFVPWLSIIDVLMFCGKEQTALHLNNFELL